jgi:uncharacterized protein (TIGR00251 family)
LATRRRRRFDHAYDSRAAGRKKTEVAGVLGDCLKIRLAAPAVEGKANAELRRFLADAFGVPLKSVVLVRGENGRRKTLRIASPSVRPDRDWEMATVFGSRI